MPDTEEEPLLGDFREANLAKHLDNPGSNASTPKETSDAKELLARDNQLRMGLNLVKSLPRFMELSN